MAVSTRESINRAVRRLAAKLAADRVRAVAIIVEEPGGNRVAWTSDDFPVGAEMLEQAIRQLASGVPAPFIHPDDDVTSPIEEDS